MMCRACWLDCGTGLHYNPFGVVHGAPNATVRHVGDFGNIEANAQGVAKGEIRDRVVSWCLFLGVGGLL